MLKEFKPAFLFLARFLALYVTGNLLYGFYIEFCGPHPDWLTESVTHQTALFLNALGEQTSVQVNPYGPTVFLNLSDKTILNVFEGCNGLNVMIVFVAFVIAFGGPVKVMPWFIGGGLIVLHLANIGRISLLYVTALRYQSYFYYVHKYFFTAILYLIVFSLWALWIFRFNDINTRKNQSSENTAH
jgi:exosortase family protein XrtF